jgi:hypothetical protein
LLRNGDDRQGFGDCGRRFLAESGERKEKCEGSDGEERVPHCA